ncbi:hypothetical protein PG997_003343 [Apiospora hydei]|uniref:Biogenesis of lysosome-related organelles complex 1 subunit 1 n=1 Tax=Apiospora hydei TaxID=1337664 RepID=A0ABR1WZ47_9PEZI
MSADKNYTALAQELEEARRETDLLRAEVAGSTVVLADTMLKIADIRARHFELGQSFDRLWDVVQWLKVEVHSMEAILIRRNARYQQLKEEAEGVSAEGTGGGAP